MNPTISIIIPFFNEVDNLRPLYERLQGLRSSLTGEQIELVMVDDGSRDGTTEIIRQLAYADASVNAVFLSRNFGHQIALTAGLIFARGSKAAIVMDGDLQDPPEIIPGLLEKAAQGNEIVYAVRKSRQESVAAVTLYKLYYRIFSRIANITVPLDSGDFCYISRKAIDVLNKMPEEQRYLRGMRAWVGFNQSGFEYDREKRFQGQSKYGFRKLLKLAYMGVFNFSEFPIKFITTLGLVSVCGGLLYFAITLLNKLLYNNVPSGFTALIGAIVLFSGVQLLSIGIIGEYVLRIFYQVKKRPLFVVKDRIENGAQQNAETLNPVS